MPYRQYAGQMTPALDRLAAVARALGSLLAEVVFIGGAVAPLLQEEPPLPLVRPTKDVDAVTASSSYSSFNRLEEGLRALGFREGLTHPNEAAHAHRWTAPDGTPFDLVPAGQHLGASGNPWDHYAVATAQELELQPELVIRHVSAAGFLALKWTAYRDRGKEHPLDSHDLEDIVALVVSRPNIVTEFESAPVAVRDVIANEVTEFLAIDDVQELLVAHLGPIPTAERIAQLARSRLDAMRQL
jgi:hypothetical protein